MIYLFALACFLGLLTAGTTGMRTPAQDFDAWLAATIIWMIVIGFTGLTFRVLGMLIRAALRR